MDYFDQEDDPGYFDFNPTYRIYQPINDFQEIMFLEIDSVVCQKQVETAIEYSQKKKQQVEGQIDIFKQPMKRSKNIIEVSNIKFQNNEKIQKGFRKQTSNFGKLIKIQFLKQFKRMTLMQKIDKNDLEQLQIFYNSTGSLKSFKKLFLSQKLCQISSQIYNSTSFIINILKSNKMQFSSKLTLLKYLKNIQNLKDDCTNCWKTKTNNKKRQ